MNMFKGFIKKYKQHLPIITCVVLGLATSFLSVNYSLDNPRYRNIFNNILIKTWTDVLADASLVKEYLFELMAYGLGKSVGFAAAITLMTVFFLSIKLKYLGKITGDFYLGAFFYSCFYLLLLEGTVVRVAFALALVMVAIYCFKQQKYWRCFFLIFLGAQIHFSVILFLLLFPVYFIPRMPCVISLLLMASPLCIIFKFSFFSAITKLVNMINPKYVSYNDAGMISVQNSTGLFFPYIVFFSILLGGIYLYLREQISTDRFIRSMLLICMTGIALMWIFYDRVAVGARLGELMLTPIVILLTALDINFKNRQLFYERIILYATSSAYFTARLWYLYIR
jgi:hypothetical protein